MMEPTMNLSDTQRIILSKAAQHQDLLAAPPALPPAPRAAIANKLLRAGLLAETKPAAPMQIPTMAWSIDGERVFLRITPDGLKAIGVEPDDGMPGEPDASGIEGSVPNTPTAHDDGIGGDGTVGDEGQGAPEAGQQATAEPAGDDAPAPAQAAPTGAQGGTGGDARQGTTPPADPPRDARVGARGGLRYAAAAVLDAWEDQGNREADIVAALDGPMQALRAALAGKPGRPARELGEPRKPREGTKQEAVLDLLRRPGGATIPTIEEATGWQAHTIRGFFAGLKRKGIEVVGEKQRGDGGSRAPTVYRIGT